MTFGWRTAERGFDGRLFDPGRDSTPAIVPRIKPPVSGRMRDLLPDRSRIVRDHGKLDPASVASAPLKCASPTTTPRYPPGAETALQGLLRGDVGGPQTAASMLSRRDVDDFDRLCDHCWFSTTVHSNAVPLAPSRRSSAPIGCCGRTSPSETGASTQRANTISRR